MAITSTVADISIYRKTYNCRHASKTVIICHEWQFDALRWDGRPDANMQFMFRKNIVSVRKFSVIVGYDVTFPGSPRNWWSDHYLCMGQTIYARNYHYNNGLLPIHIQLHEAEFLRSWCGQNIHHFLWYSKLRCCVAILIRRHQSTILSHYFFLQLYH